MFTAPVILNGLIRMRSHIVVNLDHRSEEEEPISSSIDQSRVVFDFESAVARVLDAQGGNKHIQKV